MRLERASIYSEEHITYIPATPSEKGVYETDFNGRIRLNRWQTNDLFCLFRDHPLLTQDEKNTLGRNMEQIWDQWHNGDQFELRNGIVGMIDLLRFSQNDNNSQDVAMGIAALNKIRHTTTISIIDASSYRDRSKVPLELQYALGLSGEKTIEELKPKLANGGKIAFMQVRKLSPQVHNALHTLIDENGGTSDPVIDDVLSNDQTGADSLEEKILRREARRLIHFTILAPKPPTKKTQALERRINNVIDKHIDTPYAKLRYADEALRGDIKMAIGALGISALVGVALSLEGLGTSDNVFVEAAKLAAPPIIADLLTNGAAAYPFVKEDQSKFDKLKELGKIMAQKYSLPILIGMAWAFLAGVIARELQNQGHNIEASTVLGSAIVGPAYVTNKVTRALHTERNGNEGSALHPVQSSLMVGGIVGAGATTALGPMNLLENAAAYTAASSASEPVASIVTAVSLLLRYHKAYRDQISQNPRIIFRQAVA